MRFRAPDEARLPVLVEPLAQLLAESEVGHLEQNGFGHPFSLARHTPRELVRSRHFW
jgi:hypothetical protein